MSGLNAAHFLQRAALIKSGAGFKRTDMGINLRSFTDTDGSARALTALETNALGVVTAASATDAGALNLVIPKDYDETQDHFKISLLAKASGDTDAITVVANAYIKKELTALGSEIALDAVSINDDSTDAGWAEFDFSGNSFAGDDVLTIRFTTNAHTTDALHVYAVRVEYKSDLVYYNISDR